MLPIFLINSPIGKKSLSELDYGIIATLTAVHVIWLCLSVSSVNTGASRKPS